MNCKDNNSEATFRPQINVTDRGPCLSTDEDVVGQKTEQERNIGLENVSWNIPETNNASSTLTPRIRNSTNARNIFLRATS